MEQTHGWLGGSGLGFSAPDRVKSTAQNQHVKNANIIWTHTYMETCMPVHLDAHDAYAAPQENAIS